MPIPDCMTIMLSVLRFLSDGKEHSLSEVLERIYKEFSITDEEKKQLLPSGTDKLISNRMRWAVHDLARAGLAMSTKRGFYQTTEKGMSILKDKQDKVDKRYLLELMKPKSSRKEEAIPTLQMKITESINPTELLEEAYQRIKAEVAEDLLREIKKTSPSFFENIVVELIVKMGYGGSRKDAGQAIGQSGDQGVDGIIKEDKLGLNAIYLQAKRWDGTVGRPEVHKFVGALKGQGANKGIFITTSGFSNEALDYAAKIGFSEDCSN